MTQTVLLLNVVFGNYLLSFISIRNMHKRTMAHAKKLKITNPPHIIRGRATVNQDI